MNVLIPRRSAFSLLMCLLVVTSCVGCGGGPKGPPRKTTVNVVGKVNVDGEIPQRPLEVLVMAHREGGSEKDIEARGRGMMRPDGSFTLGTYEGGDGLAVGTYKLTFVVASRNLLNGQLGRDTLGGIYADPSESEYSVTVKGDEAEAIDLGLIELKSDEEG